MHLANMSGIQSLRKVINPYWTQFSVTLKFKVSKNEHQLISLSYRKSRILKREMLVLNPPTRPRYVFPILLLTTSMVAKTPKIPPRDHGHSCSVPSFFKKVTVDNVEVGFVDIN